jgi:prepilin-type processing-associated H-X9-DG protein
LPHRATPTGQQFILGDAQGWINHRAFGPSVSATIGTTPASVIYFAKLVEFLAAHTAYADYKGKRPMPDENNAQTSPPNPYESPHSSLAPPPARRTFLGCGGCIWAIAALVLIALTIQLPPIHACREAARRMQCCNNLKNIAMAMYNYSTKYGCYPPAYTVDKQGRRMHSWRALLLEFLDRDLYAKYDFSRPWNSPENKAVADMRCGPYYCSTEHPQNSITSYVMLVGPQAFSDGPTGRKPEEISDGPANTIIVVEMSPSGILWTEPRDLNTAEMSFKINDPNQVGVRSCHTNSAHVLFADGSVQYVISNSDIEKFLKALTTINGKEDMSGFQRD